MKIKLLYILTELELTNGITSYVMNHYERLDKSKFSVDFLVARGVDEKFEKMIHANGDRIIQAPEPRNKNYIKFVKHAKEVFNQTKYDIVHSHEFNWGMPYLKEAKKQEIKVRIFHAHATKSSVKFLKQVRNSLLIPKTIKSANELFACSKMAGESFFKNKEYFLANNAIDKDKFLFNLEERVKIREELQIDENTKLIGFFGRFTEQKNTLYLLSLIRELVIQQPNYHLLLIGSGALQNDIFDVIRSEHLEEFVTILEPKADIYRYYSALDVFMLTSLYEGLPVVGIEALFNHVPQIYSNEITKELNLTGTINYLNLNDPYQIWLDKIVEVTNQVIDRNRVDLDLLSVYDIDVQSKVLQDKYLELLQKY